MLLKTKARKLSTISKKKMRIPFIFSKNKAEPSSRRQPWLHQWASPCKHPKTLSFRATTEHDGLFKTMNSVFIDTPSPKTPNSLSFADSSSNWRTSTATVSLPDDRFSDTNPDDSSSLETVIRGVRMSDPERLFFEPGFTSPSIMERQVCEELETNGSCDYSSGVAVVEMESEDPYSDFKESMAEMVERRGLARDWDGLGELLGWYLGMNETSNHASIVAAFLDILASNSYPSSMCSVAVCCSETTMATSHYSSAGSCFSTPDRSPHSPVK